MTYNVPRAHSIERSILGWAAILCLVPIVMIWVRDVWRAAMLPVTPPWSEIYAAISPEHRARIEPCAADIQIDQDQDRERLPHCVYLSAEEQIYAALVASERFVEELTRQDKLLPPSR